MSTPNKRRSLNKILSRVPVSPGRQRVNNKENSIKNFAKFINNALKKVNLNTRIPYNSPAKKPKH